jgi:hypothetical protein
MRFLPTRLLVRGIQRLDEVAVAKLAANGGDVNIALRRYRTRVLISRVPQINDLTCERIVDRERVGGLVKHRLKELAILFLGLEEMGPWAIRVVLVKQLVTLVRNSVGQCNACEHSSVLVAAEPVAHLISERTEGPGHLRRWFLPSEEIKKLIPGSGVGPKSPVNQRGREFGAGPRA